MQVVLIRRLFILIINSLNGLCALDISKTGMCTLTCFHHRVLLLLLLSIVHATKCNLTLVVAFAAVFWLNDTSLILWIRRNWYLLTPIRIVLEVIWETRSTALS